MDLDPNNHEYVSCARRVASTLEPAAALKFLQSRATADTDRHGTYAAELGNLLFRADNLDAMETVLKKSRARADRDPFRPWGMGEWPARTWLETARNAKANEDRKSVV